VSAAGDERGPAGPEPALATDEAPAGDGTDPVTGLPDTEAEAAADQAAAAASGDGPGDGPVEVEADVDAAAVDIEGEIDELAAAHAERDSYLDALRRLQADFENYKKRMIKQQTDQAERAAETLVDKLLPVLDTADLAAAHGGGEDLAQVRGALLAALEREGLERIATEGTAFDPNVHDAVAHEPAEVDGGQEVAEVLRAGYRWKGRVLRPAMVKVRG
jgi:molecular chaperone GrpE